MPEPLSTKPLSTKPLSSWKEGATRDSVIGFVEQTCGAGTEQAVPMEERAAVFDNDGTLWCEKPMRLLVLHDDAEREYNYNLRS